MTRRFRLAPALLALVLAVSLAACTSSSASSHPAGGGVATIGVDTTLDHVDPGLWYAQTSWGIADLTCTTPLRYADASGDAGKVLVPGLFDLPVASDGGRTWTFKMRTGLKFSNGHPITPADVKYTLERDLTPTLTGSPAPSFWGDLQGEPELNAGKTTTASGLIAAADTLTIKLSAPSGSIPQRMSMKWLCPVPVGTPARPIEDGSLEMTAASGPYKFKSYTPSREIVLVRNPTYPVGVLGARGFIDQFNIPINVTSQQALEEIQAGQMDSTLFPLASAEAATATSEVTMKGRVFANPAAQVNYIFLNNDVAPFNNVKVRQAVNFAIDRNQIVKVLGGPNMATPTDRILPPTFPGWQAFNAYPNTPDVAHAVQLMQESGVKTPVSVECFVRTDALATAQIVQADLAKIGINLTLHTGVPGVLDPQISKRSNHVPMEVQGQWSQDYPDGEDFFSPLLDPRNVDQPGEFARFDAKELIPQYVAAQTEIDPTKRAADYQALDQTVTTNYAPWAALNNPVLVQVISARVAGYVYNPVYNTINLALLRIK